MKDTRMTYSQPHRQAIRPAITRLLGSSRILQTHKEVVTTLRASAYRDGKKLVGPPDPIRAGLFIEQLAYLHDAHEADWLYNRREDWQEELCFSEYEFRVTFEWARNMGLILTALRRLQVWCDDAQAYVEKTISHYQLNFPLLALILEGGGLTVDRAVEKRSRRTPEAKAQAPAVAAPVAVPVAPSATPGATPLPRGVVGAFRQSPNWRNPLIRYGPNWRNPPIILLTKLVKLSKPVRGAPASVQHEKNPTPSREGPHGETRRPGTPSPWAADAAAASRQLPPAPSQPQTTVPARPTRPATALEEVPRGAAPAGPAAPAPQGRVASGTPGRAPRREAASTSLITPPPGRALPPALVSGGAAAHEKQLQARMRAAKAEGYRADPIFEEAYTHFRDSNRARPLTPEQRTEALIVFGEAWELFGPEDFARVTRRMYVGGKDIAYLLGAIERRQDEQSGKREAARSRVADKGPGAKAARSKTPKRASQASNDDLEFESL